MWIVLSQEPEAWTTDSSKPLGLEPAGDQPRTQGNPAHQEAGCRVAQAADVTTVALQLVGEDHRGLHPQVPDANSGVPGASGLQTSAVSMNQLTRARHCGS